MSTSDKDLPQSFIKARRHLLLDHPFFGSLVMHLNPVPTEHVKTIAVNGRDLRFNPTHFDGMTVLQGAGVIAHQIMSCALDHHLRRDGREADTWNEASDAIVNPIILDSGLQLPPDIEVDREFVGQHAEEAYRVMYARKPKQDDPQGQPSQQPGPQGAGGGQGQGQGQPQPGQGQPSPGGQPGNQPQPPQAPQPEQGATQPQPGGQQPGSGSGSQPGTGPQGPSTGTVEDLPGEQPGQAPSQSEVTSNKQEWEVAVQQAVNSAKSQGYYPADLERLIDKHMQPKVDWREELRKFFMNLARTESSWMRPNRRFIGQGVYLPGMRNEQAGELVVAVDTSGSVSARELAAFQAEINAIAEDTRPEKIHVVYCDARVNRVDEFTAEDLPITLRSVGGGGTDFRPVFKWIEQQGITPECVVYLTDMYGSFPKTEPDYPVLWAATTDVTGPWGHHVRVDVEA